MFIRMKITKSNLRSLFPGLPFFILILYFLASSCQSTENYANLPPPNIVWINAEDISPALGCYGDAYATTPNIDRLASQGLLYRNAFATAPICAPSRSCLATGVYATSMGAQHLRSETPKPDSIHTLPELFREAGYFTTLYGKTDYNFDPEGLWQYWKTDEAPWRQRTAGQPFLSVFTFGMTHEGRGNFRHRYDEATAELPDSLRHDPALVTVPPYYPDHDSTRQLWARYYDLVTVFDRKVGDILDNLRSDGLLDSTIVFVFSDHGFGMPRYKRWLNETGLHVPLVVRVPEAYRHLAPEPPGSKRWEMVSFVDFVPTALRLAGIPIPAYMQGRPFLGLDIPAPREYIYGARSRADDMYEVSRAVRNNRYLYIRHYMPHLPYIQPGKIFSDEKESVRLLRKFRGTDAWPKQAERMFLPKPVEELYDLQNDPQELNNLTYSADHQTIKAGMHAILKNWILTTRDVGFLHEAEMMMRSKDATPYDLARDTARYDLPRILEAAEMVGTATIDQLKEKLGDEDSGVRFWAVIGLQARGEDAVPAIAELTALLKDPSPCVQTAAAEALCHLGKTVDALPVLAANVQSEEVWTALQAARSIELIGEAARPLAPVMRQVLAKYRAPAGSPRPYVDFNYAAFISWPLEVALASLGEPVQ